MRKFLLAIPAIVLLVPGAVRAAVLINEVAWMGTLANSNAEWIELANSGSSPVDLSGWKLTSSSGSPTITLSGTIAANGYFLLERTSDDSVPGVSADQIYTGSLTNSGATLTLADASAAIVDTVVGGDGWANIGGDNTTKETAQRTPSGWVTAAPTPRAQNSGASAASSGTGDSGSSAATTSSSGGATYVPPPSALTVDTGPDLSASLEVPVRLVASVKTKSGAADPNAEFFWSFGDGSTGTGNPAEKTYHYPGTYLVEVRVTDGATSATDDLIVTAARASARIESVTGDGIMIANDSDDRLDLSGWRLSAAGASFRIPDGMGILPHASVLLPWSIMNLPIAFTAVLSYPNGIFAARYEPEPVQPPAPLAGSQEVQSVAPANLTSVSAPTHAIEAVRAPTATSELAAVGAALPPADPAPAAVHGSGFLHSPWVLGFAGVLTVAAGAFMIL